MLVLSDDLLALYLDFKQGKEVNNYKIQALLNYYHAPHLTNTEQLQQIGYSENYPLVAELAANGYISQTLEQLAQKTRYKVILNTKRTDFPYVNILDNKQEVLENNFSLTLQAGENRDKAIALIKSLCQDANYILIKDRYFCNNWNDTKQLFEQIIPHKKLTLIHNDDLRSKQSEIKKICNDWKIKPERKQVFIKAHDRYLLINNDIEIILSSGFQYLFSNDKDFTCIIRNYK